MITNGFRVSELECLLWKLKNEPEDVVPHVSRALRFLIGRKRVLRGYTQRAAKKCIVHYGLHTTGDNAGDLTLFAATRDLFDCFVPGVRWELRNLRQQVTRADVDWVNRNASCVVIGGGGLFLPDVSGQNVSGWQWPCSSELIRMFRVPIVIFGVGFNRFRSQGEFPEVFQENVNCLVEKAAFVGLRNFGSIRALSNYLSPELAKKLRFQPCPTTVLSRYMNFSEEGNSAPFAPVALNVAVDRAEMRFGGKVEVVLSGIGGIVRRANQNGIEVVVTTHARSDAVIIPVLRKRGLKFKIRHLERVCPADIVQFYKSVGIAVGMRGHAQMIPFGCGRPIASIVSHDKMAYFLEAIGRPEWGVEALSDDLESQTWRRIEETIADPVKAHEAVVKQQQVLWDVTRGNVTEIRDLLG